MAAGKNLGAGAVAFRRAAMATVLIIAFAAKAETIFLECERFKDLGGWTVESQFHGETGSSYLMAHGLGRPVADATTTFSVQTGGVFKAYVQTRNWTAKWSPKAPGAGRFHLIVNGETAPRALGADGDGRWMWQLADSVTLKTGVNTVALHDAAGFDGRADAICFTTETAFPAALRAKGVGVAPAPAEVKRDFDLVVAGGDVAGITAAISAARLGLKVALVHNRPVLGGDNSSEVRMQLGGYANVPPYPRLGDVVAEVAPAKGGNAESAATYEDDRKLAAVKAERNISLFLNTNIKSVEAVTTNGARRIVSASGVDAVTGARTRFVAPLFADCTTDGVLGALAGAWYLTGREGRDKYGEPSAPEKGDRMSRGASVLWNTRRSTGDMPFPVEPWMLAFDETNALAKFKADQNWEVGMGLDPVRDAEAIRDYGLLVIYSNWACLKNAEKTRRQFSSAVLDWAAHYSFDLVYANGFRAHVSDSARCGILWKGAKGDVFADWSKLERPDFLRKWSERRDLKDGDVKFYRAKDGHGHEADFLDGIYESRPIATDCEIGHRSISACHIANICERLRLEKLAWDPAAERFTGAHAAEANALVEVPHHNGWSL